MRWIEINVGIGLGFGSGLLPLYYTNAFAIRTDICRLWHCAAITYWTPLALVLYLPVIHTLESNIPCRSWLLMILSEVTEFGTSTLSSETPDD